MLIWLMMGYFPAAHDNDPNNFGAAHRLDTVLKKLDLKLAACSDGDEKQHIMSSIGQREKKLIGVYRQVRWPVTPLQNVTVESFLPSSALFLFEVLTAYCSCSRYLWCTVVKVY